MSDAEEHEAWKQWSQGDARCPYCIGLEESDFESVCDCWQFAKEFPEAASRPWPDEGLRLEDSFRSGAYE